MAGSFEPKADTEIIGRSGGMQVRVARSQPETEGGPAPGMPPAPDAPESGGKKQRRRFVEWGIVAAMTLACFAIFIFFLSLSFPGGHDLRELLRLNRDQTIAQGVTGVEPDGGSSQAPGNSIATLSVIHASVHSRTAGSIAWSAAPSGLGLRAGDGIQTGATGTAVLKRSAPVPAS